MSICIFNVCIVLSDFQHRILSPTFPFKLALSQALACEFAFASDFIRLYLDDLQKTSQSVFWSYLVLSDMSVRAAGAGNGSPSSGTPGSLGRCCLSRGSWIILSLSSPSPTARTAAISCEHGLVCWFFFFKAHSLLSFSCPVLVGLCQRSLAPRDTRCPGGSRAGEGQGGLVFPALQIKAAWLLCKPPQVAVIFLKDSSLCCSKLIS